MEKNFSKLTVETKHLERIILLAGLTLSVLFGVKAYKDTVLLNGYQLEKNDAVEGAYEQNVVAYLKGQKIPVTITVEACRLSEDEVQAEFAKAEKLLPDILKGENESLSKIVEDLNFVDDISDTCVEVEWSEKQLDYFYSDGSIRENLMLSEPVEVKISAILICQEYTKDFETLITILPKESSLETKLLEAVRVQKEEAFENDRLQLPQEYEGEPLIWRKPLDYSFLYFFVLTIGAVLLLKIGGKRDQQEVQKERLEELEKDYAQIVSKFSMLLSAGLSVRNAWERIVLMQRRKGAMERVIYQELNWGYRELQKGVPELEVYEKFGIKIREIHYKKLMALFISDKKRGSIHLLDTMNQEMLLAWEEQKRKTRQQGEKIGTKLLIPMMGMLGVVFVMILVPAFLSFG